MARRIADEREGERNKYIKWSNDEKNKKEKEVDVYYIHSGVTSVAYLSYNYKL